MSRAFAHGRSGDWGAGDSRTESLFANSSSSLVRVRRNNNAGEHENGDITSVDGDATIESILHEYTTACQVYGCHQRINPGILTTFRYRLPSLRVSGSFFDADMLALAEVLLHHANGALSYIRRLDFSLAAMEGKQLGKKGIRSHGAYALSRVLQMSRYIEEVFLPGNRIGPYGASAIFCAARTNPTLRTLLMRGCRIGERGAFSFVSQILMADEEGAGNGSEASCCGLREVDLSVNQIGFYGVFAVEKGLKKRSERLNNPQGKQKADREASGGGRSILHGRRPLLRPELQPGSFHLALLRSIFHWLCVYLYVVKL
ncbi:hypothetical protein ACHAXT_005961 [Thalassiosira profunda]